jgi:hypothetical protein
MPAHSVPDGLQEHTARGTGNERFATWVPRAILAAFGVLVALALANVFGQSETVSSASSSAARVTVTAPSNLRGGLLYQVSIEVDALRAAL